MKKSKKTSLSVRQQPEAEDYAEVRETAVEEEDDYESELQNFDNIKDFKGSHTKSKSVYHPADI